MFLYKFEYTRRFSNLQQFTFKNALLVTKISLRMIQNAFYFTLKALFALRVFKFLSWLFGHEGNRLDQKDKINFKIYGVTILGKKQLQCTLFPNMSRSKISQTRKFAQFIENKMRNIFLEKLYTKCGEETISRLFSKKSKLGISLDQLSKLYGLYYTVCFYCIPS